MTCIVRSPLLGPKQELLGYQLAWQPALDGSPLLRGADLHRLAGWVPRKPLATTTGFADPVLFLRAPLGTLAADSLGGLVPANTVLSLAAQDLAKPHGMAVAAALREHGFGVCLWGAQALPPEPELAALLTHVEFDWQQAEQVRPLAAAAAAAAVAGRTAPRLVASGPAGPLDHRAAAETGVAFFVDGIYPAPVGPETGHLKPEGLLVLEMMQMVQADADVRELETALKRDPALAYQLLRYLNSASFGFGVEVQSLRHAVTMMGYRPLYRWLALLLASSDTQAGAPMLMQAAVIRGRFTELLGQELLPRHEADNLFVAGMFSLLDRLLGVPIDEVLDQVQLAGPVVQALRNRGGIYGPFLQLAEACETVGGGGEEAAENAFLTAERVNHAHMAALAWAMDLRA
jgi:EAL and modified HD-GYP domain-containing signal transduction protein